MVLNRLQKLADRVYPESQCGSRSERSTIVMMFSLRQLQEKCRKQKQSLYIAFIDPTKALDLVSRDGPFKVLAKIGCTSTSTLTQLLNYDSLFRCRPNVLFQQHPNDLYEVVTEV